MCALSDIAAYSAGALLIGAGATAVTDLWAIVRQRWFGVAPLDYGLVGRWLAHVARGRFFHDAIALSPRVRRERAIGWLAHYLIGIGVAAVLLVGWGARLGLPADARASADRRHRQHRRTIFRDAAGHGRGRCREPPAAGALAQPHDAWRFGCRLLFDRLRDACIGIAADLLASIGKLARRG